MGRRDAAASPLRALAEADLFTLAGESVRQQALDYVLLEHIERPRVAGDRLWAEVVGHRDVYAVAVHVRADASGRPEVHARCGCDARRQPCRHSMAVLYAWVREPERFLDVDAALERLRTQGMDAVLELLRQVACGERELDEALSAALRESAPPNTPAEAIERWEEFRSRAMAQGSWPEAGLSLWEAAAAAPADLAVRQMACLLRLLTDEAPRDWLQARRAELLERLSSAPVEAAPAIGDLALAQRDAAWAEAALANPALADALEAHWSSVLWSSLLAARLARGPAPQRAIQAAELLAALARGRGGLEAEAAFWAAHPFLPGAAEAEARALAAAGRWLEASSAWQRALAEAAPEQAPAIRAALAEALERCGRFQDALPHRQAVWEAAPSWLAWQALRACGKAAGRWEEVWAAVRSSLEQAPAPLAGRILASEGDAQAAAAALGGWLASGAAADSAAWEAWSAALEELAASEPLAALRLAREALLALGRGGASRPPAESRAQLARRLAAVAAEAAGAGGRQSTWDRWRQEIAANCTDRTVRKALEDAAG